MPSVQGSGQPYDSQAELGQGDLLAVVATVGALRATGRGVQEESDRTEKSVYCLLVLYTGSRKCPGFSRGPSSVAICLPQRFAKC